MITPHERANITDILCIGCQKGSTSWLHSVMALHPHTHAFPDSEPVTSTDKEAHFWDWNHHRGIDWYRELMTPPEPSLQTLDFTPEYAFLSQEKIAECKAVNPTARVIYILRDPMARAVSALKMHLMWQFGKAHAEPLKLDETFFELLRKARLDAHGSFARNHAAWSRHYEDILVLNYEDFHENREASVARVMAHCGLDIAAVTGPSRARLEQLLQRRVWESAPFTIDREVLLFLQGYTWRTREAVKGVFDMTFTEGERLLSA